LIENNTLPGHAVKVWRPNDPITVAGHRTVTQLVGEDKKNVRFGHE
jgi:hypothetical protein